MSRLLATLLQWILQRLGWLVVILAILLAGSWLAGEWRERERLRATIEAQAAAVEARQREIERELGDLDGRLARTERAWGDALASFGDVERQAGEARRAAEQARARRDRLERESAWWDWLVAPGRLVELEQARAKYLALEQAARAWETTRDRIAPRFRQSPVAALQAERADMLAEKAALDALLRAQRERLERDPREQMISAVRAQLPTALLVLAGLIVAPLLVKSLFYFVLAPLAQSLPPIRILPDENAPVLPPPLPSAVSVPVDVGPGEELLAHADFIQSSSETARKRTQWFLNPRLPFSSLASGLVALTRIRPEGSTPTRVMIAPRREPLDEVAVLELPPGAAMIVQPRSLAGVVKPLGTPVAVTRHWRLASPHAWLTLQLRYLAFHGPCRLIVKGCRGVRAEQPEPGRPRLINQSATLGFSANLDYRNTRCETFVPYLRGREDLFNDAFGGGPGWFVYEEMPAAQRRTGLTGRGLEGVFDPVLKAFGI
jgi:uncharacterized protein (AIM24 family)